MAVTLFQGDFEKLLITLSLPSWISLAVLEHRGDVGLILYLVLDMHYDVAHPWEWIATIGVLGCWSGREC